MAKTAEVRIWDRRVGVVLWDETRPVPTGTFEFDPDFCAIGLQIAPLTMLAEAGQVYEFATLPEKAFKRLPPCLSDSLPDDFGNAVIDAWLTSNGRDPRTFTPVERLLYIHNRGMGALEYHPSEMKSSDKIEKIQLDAMVELAGKILSQRKEQLDGITIAPMAGKNDEAMQQLFKIGSSAGGARAKAIISINEQTGEICSGQITAPEGYGYWLLKFDVGDKASELGDPKGFGRIEYAYHLMAVAAGLDMTECRLMEEGPRAHFMTRRFDRMADGDKVHVQTLCAMDTADYNAPGSYSYESALMVCRDLELTRGEQIQLYRRMVFNIIARNQDDHTRNISFMVWRDGVWKLSPAYDVCWSYNPAGDWTSRHQMTVNSKRDDFLLEDLQQVAKQISRFNPEKVIEEVAAAVRRWHEFAQIAKVDPMMINNIENSFRLYLADR
ncbi:type II toxin-antitoxin system HipA family toxin [Pseudomonas coleopterorum]|uniref:type II toxin-antitoxin system HipA family toxin n=1 Tax=Pseudomonas coleopterorum TaxID=1605838 RepID=UPI001783D24E|nr:type II toxin-antitoxin system HipA family toxin [Pseudomonas coleopterorum]MBD8482796.1 type II toxin-antitoxin system HipA family toxin [Pseudomonas coleopterorum]